MNMKTILVLPRLATAAITAAVPPPAAKEN